MAKSSDNSLAGCLVSCGSVEALKLSATMISKDNLIQ